MTGSSSFGFAVCCLRARKFKSLRKTQSELLVVLSVPRVSCL